MPQPSKTRFLFGDIPHVRAVLALIGDDVASSILSALAKGPSEAARLASELGFTASQVQQQLERLIGEGMVAAHPIGADQKPYVFSLTSNVVMRKEDGKVKIEVTTKRGSHVAVSCPWMA